MTSAMTSSKPLANPRHEIFAQEIARGASTVDAYERAGFKRHTGNAAKLRKRDSVKKRIEALIAERAAKNALDIEEASRRLGLSRQTILDEMDRIRKAAELAGKFAGAIRGLELLGREFGLFVEKRETGKPGDFKELRTLSDEELDRQINEALKELAEAQAREAKGKLN